MSIIKVDHLTFSYPSSSDMIFDRASFQIDTDWRLGFIGRNGRGKTTFLKLLMGQHAYSGSIQSSVDFAYFPDPVADQAQFTIHMIEEICPQIEEWALLRELSYLEVDSDVLWRPFCTLSGGEQTKVLLAAMFLNEGRFLLIDEPTNHLDAKGRSLLAAYLKRKKGFILVSHDRSFLDGCVDHILSLNRANIEVQSGNFSSWMENFNRQQAFELAQNERLKKDIRRLQQAARRTSDWSDKVESSKLGNDVLDKGYVGHQAAKMMKRSKTIEARQQQAIEEKSTLLKNIESADVLKISPLVHHRKTLATLSQVAAIYDGIPVGEPISFEVQQGDRIVLDGRNGSGKSSLLKLLMRQDISHTGTIALASGLVISYVPQDTSWLAGTLSDFARAYGLDETLFKTILRKLGFERIQFEKDMHDFSGGQKKKALIARSLCQQAHLYLWDEPLNFIDVFSRMQIERLLLDAAPTMVFVEHDRAFQERIATRRIELS